MDTQKFSASMRRLLKKGYSNDISIEEIKKIFDEEIVNINRQLKPRRTRKKKICRPVMMISNSSCDESNYQSNLSKHTKLVWLPTSCRSTQ